MTQIKGYFRDGKWVPAHSDSRPSAQPSAKILKPLPSIHPSLYAIAKKVGFHQQSHPSMFDDHEDTASSKPVWGSSSKPKSQNWSGGSSGLESPQKSWWDQKPPTEWKKPSYPNQVPHPKPDEKGAIRKINEPSKATSPETWEDPESIATFLPGGKAPGVLSGVSFAPWEGHPTGEEGWDAVEGVFEGLEEPPFDPTKEPATGVVVEEPDGRVWIIHPTNEFGGYKGTFPKGRVEDGMGLQASAIKEAYEESGLKVEITGFLADVERSVTTCRYYSARRVGGTPTDCGWESQAVSLVPRKKLYEVLNRSTDHALAEALGAGPAPAPKWAPKDELPSEGLFEDEDDEILDDELPGR